MTMIYITPSMNAKMGNMGVSSKSVNTKITERLPDEVQFKHISKNEMTKLHIAFESVVRTHAVSVNSSFKQFSFAIVFS